MHTDDELLLLADDLASKPRSWLEDKLISAGLFSYDELRGPGSIYAPILAKREFAKAVLFDLKTYGGLETLLSELELEDSQELDEQSKDNELGNGASREPELSLPTDQQEDPKSPSRFPRLPFPKMTWGRIGILVGLVLAIIGVLRGLFALFYGNNLCSQEIPAAEIILIRDLVCRGASGADPISSDTPSSKTSVREPTEAIPTAKPAFLAAEASECDDIELEISELMLIPQAPGGDADLNEINEYVELHNYGDRTIDVSGLWIADTGGHPGSIVSWSEIFGGIPVGSAETGRTDIPPNGYGIVLPRVYEGGNQPYSGEIPEDALVLTLREKEKIGNGLIAREGNVLDVVVLYIGAEGELTCFISTYGSPESLARGSDPSTISDDGEDDLPIGIGEGGGFGGFFRVHPSGADSESNWQRFFWSERSPGSAPQTQTNGEAEVSPPNQIPSTAEQFVGYEFEGESPGWTTSEGDFKIATLSQTSELAHSGGQALELYTELYGPLSKVFSERGSLDVLRHTEAVGYFSQAPPLMGESGPYDFEGYGASCYVFLPEPLAAASPPAYIRLFVKDVASANLFGDTIDITPSVTGDWFELNVVIIDEQDSGFDASNVAALGIRLDTPDGSDIAYEGSIFIDDCSFKEE